MHENASKRTFLNVGPLDSLSPQSDPFEIVEEIECCKLYGGVVDESCSGVERSKREHNPTCLTFLLLLPLLLLLLLPLLLLLLLLNLLLLTCSSYNCQQFTIYLKQFTANGQVRLT